MDSLTAFYVLVSIILLTLGILNMVDVLTWGKADISGKDNRNLVKGVLLGLGIFFGCFASFFIYLDWKNAKEQEVKQQ